MKKKNRIELEIPILGQEEPMRISAKISDEALALLMELEKTGLPEWEAYKKMRKTYPVSPIH